jgi:hypothetical protein
MTRPLILAATVVFVVGNLAPAATPAARRVNRTPNLFPLTKGARWEYRRTFVGQLGTQVKSLEVRVGEMAITDRQMTVTFTGDLELIGIPERVLLTQKGVNYRGKESGGKPLDLIRNSVKAGEQWDTLMPFGCGGFAKAKATVGAPEVVEVPAGKFTAVKVTYTATIWGGQCTMLVWYADGVGVVKRVYCPDSSNIVTELVKYTPGK